MMFDWTINMGNILAVLFYVAGGLGVFYGMKSDIRVLRHDIRHIEEKQIVLNESFLQLGKILTQVAVQDTRLGMIEKYVDELRHGKGYIKE